jgi:hypothetical protein
VWSAFASSVDLLGRYVIWSGSRVSGMRHDQPFKELHGYRRGAVVIYSGNLRFLGHMVVCLKHVGITVLVMEMLKMSVNILASWSTHALSTRPGNPSVPAAL